jgi:hypothetical protein
VSDRTFPAHNLSIGDIVEPVLTGNPNAKLVGKVTEITDRGVSFGDYTIHSPGIQFRIHRFANGIPNSPAIAWLDPDRRENVALQSGHPLNHSWKFNGDVVGEDDILAHANGMPIAGLAWAEVPA